MIYINACATAKTREAAILGVQKRKQNEDVKIFDIEKENRENQKTKDTGVKSIE